MERIGLVVLASGTGSLLQALVAASSELDFPAEVIGVVTDKPGCGAARRARSLHLPVHEIDPADYTQRSDWDMAMADAVVAMEPEWVCSLGFMRLLGDTFLDRFPGRVINTHPSLLPSFAGAHAVADTLDYGVKVTGCTVHVVDRGMDTGPVLAQRPVVVRSGDTITSLHERIKAVERQLLVEVVDRLATSGYELNGRKASLWLEP